MADDSITITLSSKKDIEWLRSKVESGDYASEAEAVSESIARAREDDAEVEAWIKKVVIPRYERYKKNPVPGIPIEEVKKRLEEKWAKRRVAVGV